MTTPPVDRGVILMGGGLDSTSLLIHLRQVDPKLELHGLFIDYGQNAAYWERQSVEFFCGRYGVPVHVLMVDPDCFGNNMIKGDANTGGSNVLHGRNAVLMSIGASFALKMSAERLFVGFHQEPDGTAFTDATQHFFDAFNQLQIVQGLNVRVLAPFIKLSRFDIALLGYSADKDFFAKSHTCYQAVPGGCGRCVHCLQQEQVIAYCNNGGRRPSLVQNQ